MPPRVTRLDPPAASRFARNRLMTKAKPLAAIFGARVRSYGRSVPDKSRAPYLANGPRQYAGGPRGVYLIRRTKSPFAKTRKVKKAMKKRKTFHPMK